MTEDLSTPPIPDSVCLTSGAFAGWYWLPKEPFDALVGPFYHRWCADGVVECVFDAQEKNTNGLGIIHGGALMTFADYCLFVTARTRTGMNEVVSISTNCEFTGSALPGERIYGRGEVTRAGGSIIFARGLLRTEKHNVLIFSGAAKIIRPK
jgi:uncharacterized protein (TIGR00369 family)